MANIVHETLSEHFYRMVARVEDKKFDRQLTTIMSDVNGTLDSSELLDEFLCDWHDAGLPVLIATGVATQKLPFQIVKRLQGDEDVRGDWFVEKPFAFKDINPGMVFDDDRNITGVVNITGGKGWDIVDAIDFLEAWHGLARDQKTQALKPFLELHQQLYTNVGLG